MTDKYDGILTQMVQENKGYDGFFNIVFGFLERKTDFFANHVKAQEICKVQAETHLRSYLKREAEKKKEQQRKDEEKKLKQQQQAEKQAQQQQQMPVQQQQPKKEEIQKEEKNDKQDDKKEEKSDKLKPNSGNGSKTDTYYWTQTLPELIVYIPIDSNLNKKSLNIILNSEKIHVSKKDNSMVYIDGEWTDKIAIDDLCWTISTDKDVKIIEITVTKWRNTMHWWDSVIKTEPKIDTQKINPEPSKLSDLDGESQTTVGKMMFDMQQKQKGLPSSDELQKQDKLKDFMKAHPELDFSKAKWS